MSVSVLLVAGVIVAASISTHFAAKQRSDVTVTKQVACDKQAAKTTLDSGPDFADVDTTNGITTWRIDAESWPPIMGNPQAFVRKVADANACINQPVQHIVIRDPDGKLLGETGPAGTHLN